jgi:hypothetical protein
MASQRIGEAIVESGSNDTVINLIEVIGPEFSLTDSLRKHYRHALLKIRHTRRIAQVWEVKKAYLYLY